jgi:hypothetical protein
MVFVEQKHKPYTMKKLSIIFLMLLSLAAFAQSPNGLAPAGGLSSGDPTMGGDLSGVASNAQIVANAVDSNHIATGGVGNTDLAARIVSLSKQATNTANRLQGFDGSGNPAPITVSGIAALSAGNLAVTEVDGSTTNELQTVANTSDATSHTVTLSNSGGSVQLVEGSNITLTTTGTSGAGVVTIASTGGGGTIKGTGTANKVAKFIESDSIGNSSISDDGSQVAIAVSGQIVTDLAGNFHAYERIRSPNAAGYAGINLANSGDSTNTYTWRRSPDGNMDLVMSNDFPYTTDDDSIATYNPTTGVWDFQVTSVTNNGIALGGGGESTVVDDQVNGMDITRSGDTIRVAPDIPELPSATVASGDLLTIADVNDGNAPKQVTAGSIAALSTSWPGGILSLGGQSDNTQSFAVSTTGVDFAINSAGGIHTFHIPDASADASASARGAVTTLPQTFAGVKTFSSDPLIPDEAYNSTNWNGILEPPTKNAVRDELVSMAALIPTEYAAKLNQATDAGGVYFISHPFGATPIKYANLVIWESVAPYVVTVHSTVSGSVRFQVWNPVTGFPIALPNHDIFVIIKV